MSSQTKSAKIAWAWGGTLFASVLLIMGGLWQMLEGLAAVQSDKLINVKHDYTYRYSAETWGWIHLVIGALCILIGFLLFTGRAVFRHIAIVIVALSMISNFLFLPYYTNWPLLILAIDLLIIWALAKYEVPENDTLEASSPLAQDLKQPPVM
jgi:hypothetical protein